MGRNDVLLDRRGAMELSLVCFRKRPGGPGTDVGTYNVYLPILLRADHFILSIP